jgi:hypothetical protein
VGDGRRCSHGAGRRGRARRQTLQQRHDVRLAVVTVEPHARDEPARSNAVGVQRAAGGRAGM